MIEDCGWGLSLLAGCLLFRNSVKGWKWDHKTHDQTQGRLVNSVWRSFSVLKPENITSRCWPLRVSTSQSSSFWGKTNASRTTISCTFWSSASSPARLPSCSSIGYSADTSSVIVYLIIRYWTMCIIDGAILTKNRITAAFCCCILLKHS